MKNKLTNDKFLIAEIHYEVFFLPTTNETKHSRVDWVNFVEDNL